MVLSTTVKLPTNVYFSQCFEIQSKLKIQINLCNHIEFVKSP